MCWVVCNFILDFLYSFANILPGKREKSYTLFVFFLLYGYLNSVPLPHGAVGSSVVCDCGISWSYSLVFNSLYTD